MAMRKALERHAVAEGLAVNTTIRDSTVVKHPSLSTRVLLDPEQNRPGEVLISRGFFSTVACPMRCRAPTTACANKIYCPVPSQRFRSLKGFLRMDPECFTGWSPQVLLFFFPHDEWTSSRRLPLSQPKQSRKRTTENRVDVVCMVSMFSICWLVFVCFQSDESPSTWITPKRLQPRAEEGRGVALWPWKAIAGRRGDQEECGGRRPARIPPDRERLQTICH